MIRPGILRFLPLWPFLAVLLIALGWQQRLELAAWALERYVQVDGVDNLRVSPSSLDTEQITLTNLGFDLKVSDYLLSIDAEALSVSLEAGDGILPRASALRIGSVRIDATAITTKPSPTMTLEGLHRQLLDAITAASEFAALPIAEIRIDQLAIRDDTGKIWMDHLVIAVDSSRSFTEASIVQGRHRLGIVIHEDAVALEAGWIEPEIPPFLSLQMSNRVGNPSLSGRIEPTSLKGWVESLLTVPSPGLSVPDISGDIAIAMGLLAESGHMRVQLAVSGMRNEWAEGRMADWRIDLPLKLDPGSTLDSLIAMPHQFEAGALLVARRLELEALTLENLRFEIEGQFLASTQDLGLMLTADSSLTLSEVSYDQWRLEDVVMFPALTLGPGGSKINRGAALSVAMVHFGEDWSLGNLNATATSDMVAEPGSGGGVFSLGPGDLEFSLAAENAEGLALETQGIASITSLSAEKMTLSLALEYPALTWPGLALPAMESIRLDLNLDSDQLGFDGTLVLVEESLALAFSGEHVIVPSRGLVTVRTDSNVELSRLQGILQNWQPGLDTGLSLTDGTGFLEAHVKWNPNGYDVSANIAIEEAGGSYDDTEFSGLALDGAWRLWPTLASERPARLKCASLRYGIEASNLGASISLADNGNSLPTLRLLWLRGTLFDGQMSIGPIDIDLNAPRGAFNLNVQDLDLARVAETQNVTGLTIEGRVDGVLPVNFSSEGLRIRNGKLSDREGGVIRYAVSDEQAAALDSPLTDVVIGALRDFHYHVLEAQADYVPDGTLQLALHLEGTSPSLETDRPVHININSEQNVLSLLKSLEYASGLNQSLDQQIRDQYDTDADPSTR